MKISKPVSRNWINAAAHPMATSSTFSLTLVSPLPARKQWRNKLIFRCHFQVAAVGRERESALARAADPPSATGLRRQTGSRWNHGLPNGPVWRCASREWNHRRPATLLQTARQTVSRRPVCHRQSCCWPVPADRRLPTRIVCRCTPEITDSSRFLSRREWIKCN